MSEPADETNLTPGSTLPIPEPDFALLTIPLSANDLTQWAVNSPKIVLEVIVGGEAVSLTAKQCLFCDKKIRVPSGNQPLIEHMKSVACGNRQRALRDAALSNTTARSETPDTDSTSDDSDSGLHPSTATLPRSPRCRGAGIELSAPAWANYPWHLHGPDHQESEQMTFHVHEISRSGHTIWLRSNHCAGVVPLNSGDSDCCGACAKLPGLSLVQRIIKRTQTETPTNGLTWKYYSHKQQAASMEKLKHQVQVFRLKGINNYRNTQRLLGKLDDQKQLMYAVAESDSNAIGRIFKVALRQRCSPRTIVERLEKARDGLYRCQAYSEKSLDFSLLALRLGGRRLLSALQWSHQFPSASTVGRCVEKVYVRPSIAFPTLDELASNIKSVCGRPSPRMRGHTLMIDEVALQENIRYSYAEDLLIGLCREHSGDLYDTRHMTGRPVSELYELKDLLDLGKIHRAKEATVAAIAPFSESDYTPMTVLVSGTCKTESVYQQRELISNVVCAWRMSPHGQSIHGKLWSIATDGDPRRRQAIHNMCTSKTLSPDSPLYVELGGLELLNLACGEDEMTHDGDFKHEEKRLAGMLRSGTGTFVCGAQFTPIIIKGHLRKLPDLATDRLDSLFDNSDRQDVPKAHSLLKAIYDASQLPKVRNDPFNRPFILLAEFLHSFYKPYTTPSMSLTEQVVSLVECAFLLFAIFQRNGTRFMSAQLYYDIQSSIKNMLFCIAKTKVLDPTLSFHLLQLGDDRLEGQFGILRTMYTNSTPDLLQLAERSGAAQDVANILARYPKADRKPYRISLEGVSGVDHLNPASWIGDVCVGNVDLRSAWIKGRTVAEKVLRDTGLAYNFDLELLRLGFGDSVDLMRPCGHYVGVSELPIAPPLPDEQGHEDSLPVQEPRHKPSQPATANEETSNSPGPEDNEELLDSDLPFEYHLPPCMPAPEDDLGVVPDGLKRGWIKINSRWVHLESAAKIIFGTHSAEKSSDRLRRVRGYSKYPSIDHQSDSMLGDVCLVGQIALGLVRVEKEFALAALRVTSMTVGKLQVESIGIEHLTRADVTISGQILVLNCDNKVWYWNHMYVESNVGSNNPNVARKPLVVEFPAGLVELANPSLCKRGERFTWSFSGGELQAVTELLWAKSAEKSHDLPVCQNGSEIPYRTIGVCLTYHDTMEAIEALPAERCATCYLCDEVVPVKNYMRIHVSKHIAAKLLGTADSLCRIDVSESPCGFCGRPALDGCTNNMQTRRGSTFLKSSSCRVYDKHFSCKRAEKSNPNSPCTNRPVYCAFPECEGEPPVWSYNMLGHIKRVHGQAEHDEAVRTGLHAISAEEIRNLRLTNMLVVPSRKQFVLHTSLDSGAKQSHDDSALAEPQDADLEGQPIASGSKRTRTH